MDTSLWTDVFGVLALGSSIVMLALGLPRQILRNYRRKKTEGVDIMLIGSLCAIYLLWGTYGTLKFDIFLMIANWPGLLLVLIILAQMYMYRKPDV